MQTTIWKLQNVIKHYDWGTFNALTQLFNIQNPDNKPMAEVWMGAHPAGVSTAIDSKGNKIQLDALIAANPSNILGDSIAKQFNNTLPYLFKILSANAPLSIQVHPELSKAKAGFAKENALNIPLDSPKRNFKDPNHKPELIYALTPFWAMNAFRPIDEIIKLFTQLDLSCFADEVAKLANNPTPESLHHFFAFSLSLNGDKKQKAIAELLTKSKPFNTVPFTLIQEVSKQYPDDAGLFAPLILNVIELQPGQAMFLKAETPHAYLKGTGLEIMASSDNVLRAGLTPKYIDTAELLANTRFDSVAKDDLLTTPTNHENVTAFSVPVRDFVFDIVESDEVAKTFNTNSAEILLCLEGELTVSASDSFTLKPGESVFIAQSAKSYTYQGNAKFARAFNQ
ncbi:mannose-6-phosphate isomerase, class I [Orbaceae bacterium ac157xtp]